MSESSDYLTKNKYRIFMKTGINNNIIIQKNCKELDKYSKKNLMNIMKSHLFEWLLLIL